MSTQHSGGNLGSHPGRRRPRWYWRNWDRAYRWTPPTGLVPAHPFFAETEPFTGTDGAAFPTTSGGIHESGTNGTGSWVYTNAYGPTGFQGSTVNITTSSGFSRFANVGNVTTEIQTQICVTLTFRLDTLPTTANVALLALWQQGATTGAEIVINSTGNVIRMRNNLAATGTNGTTTLTTNTDYTVVWLVGPGPNMGWRLYDSTATLLEERLNGTWDQESFSQVGYGITNAPGVALAANLSRFGYDTRPAWIEPVAFGGGSTNVNGADTGTGVDTATLATALSGADTGVGANAATLATALTAADTAVGVDTAAVTVPISAADTGVFVDSVTAKSSTAADTGTGVDAVTAKSSTAADTGAGVDSATTPTTGLAVADTGAGVDAISAKSSTAFDTGVGADAATVDTGGTPISGSDTGTGVDTATFPAVALTAADTGVGVDGIASRALTAADAGVGADTAITSRQISVSDSGTFTDAVTAKSSTAADTRPAAVDSALVTVAVTGTDTASAANLAVLATAIATADLISLLDNASVVIVPQAYQATGTIQVTSATSGAITTASFGATMMRLVLDRGVDDHGPTRWPVNRFRHPYTQTALLLYTDGTVVRTFDIHDDRSGADDVAGGGVDRQYRQDSWQVQVLTDAGYVLEVVT